VNLPPDAPDWLEPTIIALDERARDMVCNGPSSERGAGYLKAVEDLKNEVETQAARASEKRKLALAGVRVRG
jgi:hypothetical protein